MKRYLLPLFLFCASALALPGQSFAATARAARNTMAQPLAYQSMRDHLARQFATVSSAPLSDALPGELRNIATSQHAVALTFDACTGGLHSYNAALINYLRREHLPATLFISGRWIDAHPAIFRELAADPLFEIENHGYQHHVCSVAGETSYGLPHTRNAAEVVDEIALNAQKIEALTGRKPLFFRPAAALTDEATVQIAAQLGEQAVSYGLLSGDAVPHTPAAVISQNIVKQAHNGSVVIMHFNHSNWNEEAALEQAVPKLRAEGYRFARLADLQRSAVVARR